MLGSLDYPSSLRDVLFVGHVRSERAELCARAPLRRSEATPTLGIAAARCLLIVGARFGPNL